jgi:hypothetical protein
VINNTEQLINDYLLKNREYRQRDQGHTRTGWRSSALGYCLRKQTYSRLGVPSGREFDAKTLRIFSYGDLVHGWVKRAYRDAGLMIEEEGKLSDDERELKGHYDMLVGNVPALLEQEKKDRWSPWWTEWIESYRESLVGETRDEVWFGEIKSINPRAFSYLKKDGAKRGHKLQIGSYFSMATKAPEQVPTMPDTGYLVYVSKDNDAPILDFQMEDAWVAEADEVVDELNHYWRAGELPPCTCEGWEIGYCDYLQDSGRSVTGRAKKTAVAGIDCCPPHLYQPAREAHDAALEAEKGVA